VRGPGYLVLCVDVGDNPRYIRAQPTPQQLMSEGVEMAPLSKSNMDATVVSSSVVPHYGNLISEASPFPFAIGVGGVSTG
jgi:hypothetical protein